VNAESVIEALSEASTMHQAESLKPGYDALKAFTNATQQSTAGDASGTGRTAGGGTGNANGFAEPVMLMASPSGIALSTQQSTHVSAEQHVNVVSGGSTHIASGKSLIASIGEKLSLFAQNAGMKLFAAKGKVEVQAHSDGIELQAHKGVKVISITEAIEMAGKREILLTSGGAYIRIKGGNIEIHAPGKIDVKGAKRVFGGPTHISQTLPTLPASAGAYDQAFVAHWHGTDIPAAGVRYQIVSGDRILAEGITNERGETSLVRSHVPQDAQIRLSESK
jgi:type VI secretion system secreted protein VgrG